MQLIANWHLPVNFKHKIHFMRFLLCFVFCCCISALNAQKKPLDHSVYDGWQSIGEKLISNDGKWIVYIINPQEEDNELVIQSADRSYKKAIARGYNAVITEDSRFVIFKIKPLYKETREARIKKKKPDEMPKDSLAIVGLGKDDIWKIARVKTFQSPEKGYGWVAYHLERKQEAGKKGGASDKKLIDSLTRVIDSLQGVIARMPRGESNNKDINTDADEDDPAATAAETGSDLILRNLLTGEEKKFRNVVEYVFSKNGQKLVFEQQRDPADSSGKTMVICYDLKKANPDTLSRGGNNFKNFIISDDGKQIAYVAERDAIAATSKAKDLQKYFKLWYYREGMDSAVMLVDRFTKGMALGCMVSEYGQLNFSKSGRRLFFGTAPVPFPKDTALVDIDLAKLDIWRYNDDYLQTTQLNRLRRDQQENFLAMYDLVSNKMEQLGSREIPLVIQAGEGDGTWFAGITDVGKRIESQWTGSTKKDIYAINVQDGSKQLVKKELDGVINTTYVSPSGKYILWYDHKTRNYFAWDGQKIKNISNRIETPLYNEEHDSPSDPSPYGIMGWSQGDSNLYIYDRYDIWQVDMQKETITSVTGQEGRKNKTSFRYVRLDPDEKFIPRGRILVRRFNDRTKMSGLSILDFAVKGQKITEYHEAPYSIGQVIPVNKSIEKGYFLYTKENFQHSPDLYLSSLNPVSDAASGTDIRYALSETQLTSLNPQQQQYNWGSAELFTWKTYTGRESTGILYKPEDFDPRKKYPMICYFYETLSDGLYTYQPPSPTPSRLNIPFFVSRGYIVFAPDIHYSTGHPGKDAYDYVVSGARAVVKQGFVDSTRIGIQGQSWGGYQVAYLVTATNLFRAAWAGAPVANMTSAYGGIRWESGLNRQFQYEKTQSRIGATLWEKPELYIENSPLFYLPKVKTPLVIMSNDADGAVPWYQGIELFTAMRRLGKKVWLLNYNGEAHNLVERKNRKDIQVREQQYFDWLLKNAAPPRWITEGVPALNKGKDWGL